MPTLEDIEQDATAKLSRLWRTVTGDLPHPPHIMRLWFRAEDPGEPVVKVCLVAGQEAPPGVLAQAATVLRDEEDAFAESGPAPGGVVQGRIGADDIRVHWSDGIVLVIMTGAARPVDEALPATLDQFVPYPEGAAYTDEDGPSSRVHDSANASARVLETAVLLREAYLRGRLEQIERQSTAKDGRRALRLRTGRVGGFLGHAAEVAGASGVGLLVVGGVNVFDPDHKQAGLKCFAFAALLFLACAQILLVERRFWPILGAAVGGTAAVLIIRWPELRIAGYAFFLVEAALYAWLLPTYRASLRAKRA
ncbi:hypothetical protein [Nocardia africana]|uniref:Uncharacterized protein n=1 Tax=Nocardia africana TaxID=134964 RepID=A0A378WVU8_9NOCA|nr:hypothetical protein [Nocardia africana]MCC3313739.1 hypothetical protein [Nocardia africana]SUA44877.1 Uncharacterised protein [Nocardia africana]